MQACSVMTYEAWPSGRLAPTRRTECSERSAYSVIGRDDDSVPVGYIETAEPPSWIRPFRCMNGDYRCIGRARILPEALVHLVASLPAHEGMAALVIYPDGPPGWDPRWRAPASIALTRRVLSSYLATPVTLARHASMWLGASDPATRAVDVMATPMARSYGFGTRASRGPVALVGLLPAGGQTAAGHLMGLLSGLQGGCRGKGRTR